MSEAGSTLDDSAAVDFSGQPDPPPAASQPAEAGGGRVQKASQRGPLTVAVDEGGDIEVPDFSGKTMRDVTDVVLRLSLEPVLVGSGLAIEQSPLAGAKVRHGAKITVQFGTPVEKKSKPRQGIRN
jgi:beta-lactam-binding protein with PASTA domain